MSNELSLITRHSILRQNVADNYFYASAWQTYLRAQGLFETWQGGLYAQDQFLYNRFPVHAVKRGQSVRPTRTPYLAGLTWDLRIYKAPIVEDLIDLELVNRGPNAVFKLIDLDLTVASASITDTLAIVGNFNGQNISASNDRSMHVNGWVEALNDGVNVGWDGNVYTSYGDTPRAGLNGALNSTPFYCGTPTGELGILSPEILSMTYNDLCIGMNAPDIGVGSKSLVASIEAQMLPQQVISMEDPYYRRMTGLKWKKAIIFPSDLWPSQRYGRNTPSGNYDTTNMTVTAPAGITRSFSAQNISPGTTLKVGDVFAWFNTGKWYCLISDSELFGMGFTGWHSNPLNYQVAGSIQVAQNGPLTREPRLAGKQIFGCTTGLGN